MANTGIRKPEPVQVKGLNGKGAISLPGIPVGSAVFGVINITSGANETANFESTTSAPFQIQQTSTANLSGNEYWVFAVAAG
jgi:hypothetical protein